MLAEIDIEAYLSLMKECDRPKGVNLFSDVFYEDCWNDRFYDYNKNINNNMKRMITAHQSSIIFLIWIPSNASVSYSRSRFKSSDYVT